MEKRARAVNSLFWLKQLENENRFLFVEIGSHFSLPYWISYLFDDFIIVWMKLKDPWTKNDHKVNSDCKAFMLKMVQTTSTLFRTCAKVMHFYPIVVCNLSSTNFQPLMNINPYPSSGLFLISDWHCERDEQLRPTWKTVTHPGLKWLIFKILLLTFQHPRKDLGIVFSYSNSFLLFSRTSKATISSW